MSVIQMYFHGTYVDLRTVGEGYCARCKTEVGELTRDEINFLLNNTYQDLLCCTCEQLPYKPMVKVKKLFDLELGDLPISNFSAFVGWTKKSNGEEVDPLASEKDLIVLQWDEKHHWSLWFPTTGEEAGKEEAKTMLRVVGLAPRAVENLVKTYKMQPFDISE